jgi:hypothetical protein
MHNYNFDCCFYGRETWSLTLRKKHRVKVLKNTVLRKISESKRNEVREEWRRLHVEELCSLYPSSKVIRVINARRIR